jgi:hypothetical protein
LGGDGDTGFPSLERYKELLREQGEIIDDKTIGFKYNSVKKAYEIWNNHTDRNDFDLFWKEIHSKYRDSGLTLEKYTRQCIADKNHKECQPIEQAAKKQRIIGRSDSVTTAIINTSRNNTNRKLPPPPLIKFLKKKDPISIFNRLVNTEEEINKNISNDELIEYIENMYEQRFEPSFGEDTEWLFDIVLERWKSYPVRFDLSGYLGFYIGCYDVWNLMNIKEEYENDFDDYYELYENNLKETWKKVRGNFDKYQKEYYDFDKYIQNFHPDILAKEQSKGEKRPANQTSERQNSARIRRRTDTTSISSTSADSSSTSGTENLIMSVASTFSSAQQSRPCTVDEDISQNPTITLYNNLINCLDVGKDAASTQGLRSDTHGPFMLNNVIKPLFDYESLTTDPSTQNIVNNFTGVGDRSIIIFNEIRRQYTSNLEYIPIIKYISRDEEDRLIEQGTIPNITGVSRTLKSAPLLYTIQDAGYAPQNLFRNYINLFTFATMLDTASKTVDANTLLLTNSDYEISQNILKKYGLDKAIKKLSYDASRNLIKIETTNDDTINEYFNNDFNPVDSRGEELEQRGTTTAERITDPTYYSKGNAYKNMYINASYNIPSKRSIIRKLVLTKELGDTLQAAILDQMLIYKTDAFQKYQLLKNKSDTELPFCRENCVITTNDYNLLSRCLLNNINSIITSGAHVIRTNNAKLAPFYQRQSLQEIAQRNEQLKVEIIEDLYSKNKEVIELLYELGLGDLNNVYFGNETIEMAQKKYLNKQLKIAKKRTDQQPFANSLQEDLSRNIPRTVSLRKYFLKYVLLYMSSCLDFVNEKIKEVLKARPVRSDTRGVSDTQFYLDFLLEVEKLRFDSPFEISNLGNQIIYKYKGNEKNKFSFLPKLFGVKEIKSQLLNSIEGGLSKYFYTYINNYKNKYNYEDFSLFYYFQINKDGVFNRTNFDNGTIGSIYRVLNNRIESKNFVASNIHAFLKEQDNYYLIVAPAIYEEIDLCGNTQEQSQNINMASSQETTERDRNIQRNPIRITSEPNVLEPILLKQKIFNKCINPFFINNLINTIGWSEYFHDVYHIDWIHTNSPSYYAELSKLEEFSKLFDLSDRNGIIHHWFSNDISNNIYNNTSNNISYNVSYNKDIIKTEIQNNFNMDISMFLTTCLTKEEEEVIGDFRKKTIVDDTLVLEDWRNYPTEEMAKQLYLNREIAEFINQIVEKYIILEINNNQDYINRIAILNEEQKRNYQTKLHLICANLILDLKRDLQAKVKNYIRDTQNIIRCPDISSIQIKDIEIPNVVGDRYTGRVDDTSLNQDFWADISLNNISFNTDNYLTIGDRPIVGGGSSVEYDVSFVECYTALAQAKYQEIVRTYLPQSSSSANPPINGSMNTDNNSNNNSNYTSGNATNTNTSTSTTLVSNNGLMNTDNNNYTSSSQCNPQTNPSSCSIQGGGAINQNNNPTSLNINASFANKLTSAFATDLTVFEPTIFQKYFQNVGPSYEKPGLLTFHMLCYFPKIIFMVYSLLKYIEADPQLQTLYNASYMSLKDILVKFYERDFSDELNRIFHDMVGESVEPTYESEGTTAIEVLTNYDNATADIIDIAQQMYNVAGLFKMGEEKFKADLALFNTNVLKKEPGSLFLKIAENENKHDIEYLYGRLFDAEYYVCETKGAYKKDDGTYGEEFNSIRVFEKFLANGVYSYGPEEVAEPVAHVEAKKVQTIIPENVAPWAPIKQKTKDVGFITKMFETLGFGNNTNENPTNVYEDTTRKLNFNNPTAPVYGGAKKTRKRSSSAKRYKKTRKNPKHRA